MSARGRRRDGGRRTLMVSQIEVRAVRQKRARTFDMATLRASIAACDHASLPRRARCVGAGGRSSRPDRPMRRGERRRRACSSHALRQARHQGLRRAAAKDESHRLMSPPDRLAELLKSRADARLHCTVFACAPPSATPRPSGGVLCAGRRRTVRKPAHILQESRARGPL